MATNPKAAYPENAPLDEPSEGGIEVDIGADEPVNRTVTPPKESSIPMRGLEYASRARLGVAPWASKPIAWAGAPFGFGEDPNKPTPPFSADRFDAAERKALALDQTIRDRTKGIAGGALEFAGGFADPVNYIVPFPSKKKVEAGLEVAKKLGIGEVVRRRLAGPMTGGAFGALGAAGGALSGLEQYASSTPTRDMTWSGAGEAAKIPAIVGGVVSPLIGHLMGRSAGRAVKEEVGALSPTASHIKESGKLSGQPELSGQQKKLEEVASYAAREGDITGRNYGQTVRDSLEQAKLRSDEFGKQVDNAHTVINKKLPATAYASGSASQMKDDLVAAASAAFTSKGGRLTDPEKEALVELRKHLNSQFPVTKTTILGPNGQPLLNDPPVHLGELDETRRKIQKAILGDEGNRKDAGLELEQAWFVARRAMREMYMKDAARYASPADVAALKQANRGYHLTELAQGYLQNALKHESGQRNMQGLMGVADKGLGWMIAHSMGIPPLGVLLGGARAALGQRGVMPNTLMRFAKDAPALARGLETAGRATYNTLFGGNKPGEDQSQNRKKLGE